MKSVELYQTQLVGATVVIHGALGKLKVANALGGAWSATKFRIIEIQGNVTGPLTITSPRVEDFEVWGKVQGKLSLLADRVDLMDLRGDILAELLVRGSTLSELQIDGTVRAAVALEVDLLARLTAGDIRADFTVGKRNAGYDGNVITANVGRIIGNTFHVAGDVKEKFSTRSARAKNDDWADKMLVLKNSGEADGVLKIDRLSDTKKVVTK